MITLKALEQAVRDLAKEYPNATYDNAGDDCYYAMGTVTNGPPSEGCIIGQALYMCDVGLDLDAMNDWLPAGFGQLGPRLQSRGVLEEGDLSWFSKVQRVQDNEGTWAEAIEHADAIVLLT